MKLSLFTFLITLSLQTCSQSHIYNPDRLRLISPHIELTGMVLSTKHEPDGDLHFRLLTDSGIIVCECICQYATKQANAKRACVGYLKRFKVKKGDRVRVSGPLVWDKRHFWKEVHAVEKITKLNN